MCHWLLLNTPASVRCDCDNTSCKGLITVLLRGICGRYAVHKLGCIAVSIVTCCVWRSSHKILQHKSRPRQK